MDLAHFCRIEARVTEAGYHLYQVETWFVRTAIKMADVLPITLFLDAFSNLKSLAHATNW
jgi:hypothetical protein